MVLDDGAHFLSIDLDKILDSLDKDLGDLGIVLEHEADVVEHTPSLECSGAGEQDINGFAMVVANEFEVGFNF
jgi:hypothetical protein